MKEDCRAAFGWDEEKIPYYLHPSLKFFKNQSDM
jgi:hypothetical protein